MLKNVQIGISMPIGSREIQKQKCIQYSGTPCSNVIASQLPERQTTGTLAAHANFTGFL